MLEFAMVVRRFVARLTVVAVVAVTLGVAPVQVQRPAFASDVETVVATIEDFRSEAALADEGGSVPDSGEKPVDSIDPETDDDADRAGPSGDAEVAPSADESLSTATESPIPFSMLGFEVSAPGNVQFRVSVDGEVWEPWQAAAFHDSDDGPDGAEAEAAHDMTSISEPIWVGEARFVQMRSDDLQPDDVKAHVIDSMGLSQALGERALGVVKAAFRAPEPVAAHASSQPHIVTRSQWGADESLRKRSPSYASSVDFAVVHHTAGSNDYTASQAPGIVRGIYSYHTQALGWADIGYNMLVDKYGVLYEGRYGGLDKAVIGAHARNFNSGSFGISILGNYEVVRPSAVSVNAMNDAIAWKFGRHGVDPSVVPARSGVDNAIIGHRDVGQTACPGRYVTELLPTIRSTVQSRMGVINIWNNKPPSGAAPLMGDWNGDGTDTPGWFKDGQWALYNKGTGVLRLSYGAAGDVPVTGDWNGDGRDTVGVVRDGNLWLLRRTYTRGDDVRMTYGKAGDIPVTGDWNGDGIDTIGVVRGNRFILRYQYRSGSDIVLRYGEVGDEPVTGDFNGDGRDTVGVVRGNLFILRYRYTSGSDIVMSYGVATDQPVIGDFNNNGTDTLGIRRGPAWVLRYAYRSGADIRYEW